MRVPAPSDLLIRPGFTSMQKRAWRMKVAPRDLGARQAGSTSTQRHVLFLTDRPAKLEAYASYLGDRGQKVTVAATADEAWHDSEAVPDILFFDLGPTPVAGLQTLRMIKAAPLFGQVPLVLLASIEALAEVHDGLLRGARDYLIIDETTPASLARQLPLWGSQPLQIASSVRARHSSGTASRLFG